MGYLQQKLAGRSDVLEQGQQKFDDRFPGKINRREVELGKKIFACAIKDINVDYMLVCGDFNCVLKNDLVISGEKHVERIVLKFNDLLSDCDLHDT